MTIEQMVDGSLDGIFNAASSREESEVKDAVAVWLRGKHFHVCENDNELRELALTETDLKEPNNDD